MKIFPAITSAAWAATALLSMPKGESAPCNINVEEMTVATTADAADLIAALKCDGGGRFEVSWLGKVVIGETIEVFGGSILAVTGSDNSSLAVNAETETSTASTIDGGGMVRIFNVSGESTLTLQGLVLQGGSSTFGGAVLAHSPDFNATTDTGNTIKITNCSFLDNQASIFGGQTGDGGNRT